MPEQGILQLPFVISRATLEVFFVNYYLRFLKIITPAKAVIIVNIIPLISFVAFKKNSVAIFYSKRHSLSLIVVISPATKLNVLLRLFAIKFPGPT